MWPILVIIAQLTVAQINAAKAAYHKLPSADIETHKAAAAAPKTAQRIEVSERMRSASFGQRKFLLVAEDAKQFWVEYFPATNRPGALYGPFEVTPAATSPAPAPTPPSAPAPSKK